MKSKIKTKSVKIPGPFETHKTEWTRASKIAEWINIISKERAIPIGKAEVETTTEGSKKRVDVVIFESPTSQNILCVIEAKLPYFDVFNENLKDDARKKANERASCKIPLNLTEICEKVPCHGIILQQYPVIGQIFSKIGLRLEFLSLFDHGFPSASRFAPLKIPR